MEDCLSKEKLESLNRRELRGKELFAALKHIESCEKCRRKVKLPAEEEILKRFQEEVTPNK